jgi:hypothetical protein
MVGFALDDEPGKLHARSHVELAEDGSQVKADGVTGQEEPFGGFLVGEALGDERRHTAFGVRQAGPPEGRQPTAFAVRA